MEDGKILLGGNIIKTSGRCQDGWFYEPTIIEGLDINSRVNQEEIFVPWLQYNHLIRKQAIENANGTDYGLSVRYGLVTKKETELLVKLMLELFG